jgi:hypothetical protein
MNILWKLFYLFIFVVINLKCNKFNGRPVYCPIQAENCGFSVSASALNRGWI